jgi:hypothetical protein
MGARRVLVALTLTGLVLLVLPGCGGGNKVTKGNFDKVKTGMALAEVEEILGEGTEQAGVGGAMGGLGASGKIVTWTEGEKTITVTFVNGKVAMKAQKGL